ncbi:MAG: translation elongation factor Ts [Chloroflexi bacterium]|nr:translation elongation factor Ts [Chloroflexota bacterium]
MQISAAAVKELRERSGAGVMECKSALEQTGGNMEKALAILREQGLAKAEKRAGRVASQGLVEAYLHAGGRIGALVELNCETDFVARTDDFKVLAHDLAMQVAATNPRYITEEDIPEEEETSIDEDCLVRQPFIKDPSKTIRDLLHEAIGKTGENIRIRRISRFELGAE